MFRPVCAAAALSLMSLAAHAENIVAIDDLSRHLISFDSATPGVLTGNVAVTGLPSGAQPIALDYQAGSATLYLVARGPDSGTCQLYTVDTSGAATALGASYGCGTPSDIDLDPHTGLLRNLGGNDNYQVNPGSGGKTQETALTYAAGDAGAGVTPAVAGSAYSNNFAGAAATTLYAIETMRSALVRVGSADGAPDTPDQGVLTTIGPLGLSVGGDTALDISPAGGTAYMATFIAPAGSGSAHLFTVDLSTGAAAEIGSIGSSSDNVVALFGLTVAPGFALTTTGGSGGSADFSLLRHNSGGASSPLVLMVFLLAAAVRRRSGYVSGQGLP